MLIQVINYKDKIVGALSSKSQLFVIVGTEAKNFVEFSLCKCSQILSYLYSYAYLSLLFNK